MGVITDNQTLNMVIRYYFLSGGGVGVNKNVYLSLSVTPHSRNRLFICTIKDSELCVKETCYIDHSSVYHINESEINNAGQQWFCCSGE